VSHGYYFRCDQCGEFVDLSIATYDTRSIMPTGWIVTSQAMPDFQMSKERHYCSGLCASHATAGL